jgi:hypothetical protein
LSELKLWVLMSVKLAMSPIDMTELMLVGESRFLHVSHVDWRFATIGDDRLSDRVSHADLDLFPVSVPVVDFYFSAEDSCSSCFSFSPVHLKPSQWKFSYLPLRVLL